jgi:DtxR family Mn-dependent transcriptional regulator
MQVADARNFGVAMTRMAVSSVQEDYLRTIYLLSQERPGQPVPAAAVIERLGAAPATVTETVKRLATLGLLVHVAYKGVTLTPLGERAALAVIRHHRLLEQYLATALGMPWDQVHAEADRLEHALSEDLAARIALALGHPTVDPHGDPIPAADLSLPPACQARLSEVPAGATVVIQRVGAQEPARLRYLAELGLMPGTTVVVTARAPFAGPLHLRVGCVDHALGHDLAEQIFVAVEADGRDRA